MKPAWLSLAACPIEKVAGHFSSGCKGERRATMHYGLILERTVFCLSLTGLIAILIYGGVVAGEPGAGHSSKGFPAKPTTPPASRSGPWPSRVITARPQV